MAARTINIFLASSDELINDRNSFHSFIATLDDIYESRGIRVKLKRWEDFSAFCTGERTQDDYNKVVRASDMCIAMFHRKAGKFTIEEFHQALDEYKNNKKHPKTYVYARVLIEGETEEQELTDFKKELFQKMGHYWCNYATDDSMKLHFVMQFERYIAPQMESGINSSITVENGIVRLHNREIARYENLPFAFNNEQYTRLKEDITREETEIIQLRSIGNDALQPMINEKIEARDKKRKMLEEIERNLFEIALYISKLHVDGKLMSERKRRAIELFEQGKNREAAAVLNEDEIAEDVRRASDKIAQGKALIEVGNELYEKGMAEIHSFIDEYILKAKSLIGDYSIPNRVEECIRVYKKALALAEENMNGIDIVKVWCDCGDLMCRIGLYSIAESLYLKTIKCCHNQKEKEEIEYKCSLGFATYKLALVHLKLGKDYNTIESEFYYALNSFRSLMEMGSDVRDLIAMVLKELGGFYYKKRDFNQTELKLSEALNIYNEIENGISYLQEQAEILDMLGHIHINNNIQLAELELVESSKLYLHETIYNAKNNINAGLVLKDLGTFYKDRGFSELAIKWYGESLRIFQCSGDTFFILCRYTIPTLIDLGGLYEKTERRTLAFQSYQKALSLMFEDWDMFVSSPFMAKSSSQLLDGILSLCTKGTDYNLGVEMFEEYFVRFAQINTVVLNRTFTPPIYNSFNKLLEQSPKIEKCELKFRIYILNSLLKESNNNIDVYIQNLMENDGVEKSTFDSIIQYYKSKENSNGLMWNRLLILTHYYAAEFHANQANNELAIEEYNEALRLCEFLKLDLNTDFVADICLNLTILYSDVKSVCFKDMLCRTLKIYEHLSASNMGEYDDVICTLVELQKECSGL